jgi:hypothetical protein
MSAFVCCLSSKQGCPSDPKKSAQIKAMNRAWAQYIADGGEQVVEIMTSDTLSEQDPVYLNATRLALKFSEHTWGLDVKSYLFDNSDYSNSYFESARVSGPNASQYETLEQSWLDI